MNPLVLYFASGESLYSGAVLLLLAVAMSPMVKHGWHQPLRNAAAWLGLVLMIMASPPFIWALDVIFLAAFTLWLITASCTGKSPGRTLWRTATSVILVAMLLLLPALDYRHRRLPIISGVPIDHLVVIGDSISAGIDSHVPPWPTVMQQMTGVPVNNLSLPGADTAEALTMAGKLNPEDRLVLIEIGGNDLLSGVSSEEFTHRLDALLRRASSPGRTVVMFELPLLPPWVAHGRAQRRLAERYGVFMIPKKEFASVMSGGSATLDGLHLSDVGARRMATLVARVLNAAHGVQ